MKRAFLTFIITFLLLNSIVYALNGLSPFNKFNFHVLLNEYICKSSDNALIFKNKEIHNRDLSNIKKAIYEKVIESELYYNEYVVFLNENKRVSPLFYDINSRISQKRKFDLLQSESKNIAVQSLPRSSIRPISHTSSFKDHIFYSFSLNLLPENILTKNDASDDSGLTAAQKEYMAIGELIVKIEDLATLREYGPSIILRSENLMSGNDNSLNGKAITHMLRTCGVIKVALNGSVLMNDVNLDNPEAFDQFIEYVKSAYSKINLTDYKVAAMLFVYEAYEYPQKYVESLEFMLNAKNDVYSNVTEDLKFYIAFYIGQLACKCPIDKKYYEIGLEHFNMVLELIGNPPIEAKRFTPEQITDLMISLQLNGYSVLYEKYQKYEDAIKALDYVIKNTPEMDFNHKQAVERKNKILSLMKPPEIAEIKFLRSDGSEVKWGDILEIDQEYYIQVLLKESTNLEMVKVKYYSDYTSPTPKEWILKKKENSDEKTYEYKITVNDGIVGKINNTKLSFMALDYVKNPMVSNFEDSKEFIKQCEQIGYLNYGIFRTQKGANVSTENLNSPIIPNTVEAMQNAGIELLKIECGNIFRVLPFSIQASILYFSGHGEMKDNKLLISADSNGHDIFITPAMVNKWNSNLKVVILAGCSVLNMKKYYPYENTPFNPFNTPGFDWSTKGPYLFLGYRGRAPGDLQNNIFYSKNVINKLFTNFKNDHSYQKSWMSANLDKTKLGKNACVIDTLNKIYYFYRSAACVPDTTGGKFLKRHYVPDNETY